MSNWGIFQGDGIPHDGINRLPAPPGWRLFNETHAARGAIFQASAEEIELVNAALYLRRPLLITGKPGIGKSSLAYAVAHELKLGRVLRWSITTRSTLHEGLYHYDAIGRLQEANLRTMHQPPNTATSPAIGHYLRLGPLGTALLPTKTPQVLLVDEIDKSDIDLPNDLLHVFEEGEFVIPELARLPAEQERIDVMTWDGRTTPIEGGHIRCATFPIVFFTSNGERDFPPAFLRRCLRLTMQPPGREKLLQIAEAHLTRQAGDGPSGEALLQQIEHLVDEFLKRRERGDLATDQLLNAVYFVTQNVSPTTRKTLCDALFEHLST